MTLTEVFQIVMGILVFILTGLGSWSLIAIVGLKIQNARLDERIENYKVSATERIKELKENKDSQYQELRAEITKLEKMISALHQRMDGRHERS